MTNNAIWEGDCWIQRCECNQTLRLWREWSVHITLYFLFSESFWVDSVASDFWFLAFHLLPISAIFLAIFTSSTCRGHFQVTCPGLSQLKHICSLCLDPSSPVVVNWDAIAAETVSSSSPSSSWCFLDLAAFFLLLFFAFDFCWESDPTHQRDLRTSINQRLNDHTIDHYQM